jgi:hypothetical protein
VTSDGLSLFLEEQALDEVHVLRTAWERAISGDKEALSVRDC